MDPNSLFCPNEDCPARGQSAQSNISVHSLKERRFICRSCGKTFSERKGTAFYRLRSQETIVTQVVTLLAFGCPPQAIVAAFGFDQRTIVDWERRASLQAESVHKHLGRQPRPIEEVQCDELRVKAQGQILWMASAIESATRLWLGGAVSDSRDLTLIITLIRIVKSCTSALSRGILFCTDGLQHYIRAIREVYREAHHTAKRGRPPLVEWPRILIAQVIKRKEGGRLKEVERRIIQGSKQEVEAVRHKSRGAGVLNTSLIERLNGTFRGRIAGLGRRTRGLLRIEERVERAMWLVGVVYNFCSEQKSLRMEGLVGGHKWLERTPAMAAGLTDHSWSVGEMLRYRVPPERWRPPKQRGRPSKAFKRLIERWC